jgi:hypothetical protein
MTDGEYLVLIYNQDGGEPMTRHPSLAAAKTFVMDYISDPENDPAPTADLIERVKQDLRDPMIGPAPFWVYGESAWSETIWIIPVPDCEQGRTIRLDLPGGI